ncbi:leucine-rich repeat receptor-like serine/threonine-protein kinase BAM3 [Lycium ferocissimum]|uniref:leucine-rich repeat receptor-like serine/threonine-protein kinase BAM3 n=1 Tax=Lycium ferocissimum TaxID=112874 RepID=UPI002815BFA4|nr:leucine-rich repeat receptor-like serine/threonine-protein kinase BAM3 [Lycium ferocissimum]
MNQESMNCDSSILWRNVGCCDTYKGSHFDTIGNLSSRLEVFEIAVAHISGFIPTSTGKHERFSSKFPLILWKMSGPLYLDASQNSIEGEVPEDIGGLKAIVELTLSSTIPKSLEKLSYLKSINVSFNILHGEIPDGGVFANSTRNYFRATKVYVECTFQRSRCALTNLRQQSLSKELLLKIVTPVIISSFLILLLVSIG